MNGSNQLGSLHASFAHHGRTKFRDLTSLFIERTKRLLAVFMVSAVLSSYSWKVNTNIDPYVVFIDSRSAATAAMSIASCAAGPVGVGLAPGSSMLNNIGKRVHEQAKRYEGKQSRDRVARDDCEDDENEGECTRRGHV